MPTIATPDEDGDVDPAARPVEPPGADERQRREDGGAGGRAQGVGEKDEDRCSDVFAHECKALVRRPQAPERRL